MDIEPLESLGKHRHLHNRRPPVESILFVRHKAVQLLLHWPKRLLMEHLLHVESRLRYPTTHLSALEAHLSTTFQLISTDNASTIMKCTRYLQEMQRDVCQGKLEIMLWRWTTYLVRFIPIRLTFVVFGAANYENTFEVWTTVKAWVIKDGFFFDLYFNCIFAFNNCM